MKKCLSLLFALALMTSVSSHIRRKSLRLKTRPNPSGRIRRRSKRVGSSSHPGKLRLIPRQAN
jgi:hypothetical protein